MGVIYELSRYDGLRCNDMHTKFRRNWFRHPKVDKGDTQAQRNVLLFFYIKKNRLKTNLVRAMHKYSALIMF
jgi:hypothetical protein